jgi:hypothetical protein
MSGYDAERAKHGPSPSFELELESLTDGPCFPIEPSGGPSLFRAHLISSTNYVAHSPSLVDTMFPLRHMWPHCDQRCIF